MVLGRFSSDAEVFKGWTGGIQTVGYHILGVYKLIPGRLDFLARYAELDNLNIPEDALTFSDDSGTHDVTALWNKSQIQLSLKLYLAKWAWIQTEYYFNFEGPKGDVAWKHKDKPFTNNDVFFIELVLFYM